MSELLTTYLQDHHAGSRAGIEAFERIAETHGDAEVRAVVGRLAPEIVKDKDDLETIMDAVGASPSTVKEAGAWMVEKLGRLKPNDRLVSRSPLSDIIELDALISAVHEKGLLWNALMHLGDPRIDPALVLDLAGRAARQEQELELARRSQVHKLHQD